MTDVAVNREGTNYETHDKTHGAIHRANTGGSDPRNVFGAARHAKTWGRSRPWQCFVRVLQRVS